MLTNIATSWSDGAEQMVPVWRINVSCRVRIKWPEKRCERGFAGGNRAQI